MIGKFQADPVGKPSIISQWHIDSTLAAISKTSSHIASVDQDRHAGLIFSSLCKLFNYVLVIHRTKLGGRYHLIIPALQSLLQNLFISYRKNSPSIKPTTTSPPKLGKAHAAAYSRLLTTICDPTLSSVTKRPRKTRPRHNLNDETKQARTIAGQHLQYLIMDFCTNQLQGRLEPELKAALIPGLYAIFDVMSQDVMRSVNAAMDSSCRSIFKGLYGDYRRRVGRGG